MKLLVTTTLSLRTLIGSAALLATPGSLSAQAATDTSSASTTRVTSHHERENWAAASVLLAASLAFDERIRAIAIVNRTPTLDRLAAGADILGTASHIVPALVTTYVAARVGGNRSLAAATLRVGLSYATADAMESLLKPAIGRQRPYVGGEPLTFRPFSRSGDFHSFPSAHVVHISSLAAAIAMESSSTWVRALAGTAISYVGVQRVYRDQHWSSDVVASGMLGVEVARAMTQWLRALPNRREQRF